MDHQEDLDVGGDNIKIIRQDGIVVKYLSTEAGLARFMEEPLSQAGVERMLPNP